MTLLQKIGSAILKGIGIVTGLLPLVTTSTNSGVIATVSKDMSEIATIVTEVEAAGQALNLPGVQKLQMAAPLVAQIILASSMMANHKVANPTLFSGGAQKIADGMADVLNSLDASTVQVTSKAS